MKSNLTGIWGRANITSQDTLEVAFALANCLVLLVTLHIGILANFFVTWAVYRQKSLQTSNNALLVNLAVIDILRCVIDCPLLLTIVLSVRNAGDFGIVFCSAQIASFSLICCVQLFTLACISAERYQAVARPFKNAERRRRITVSIILTWVVPISISILCVIFAKDSPVYVRCRGSRLETLDSYDTFGFYILTPIWCVCLTVIIGFYARIFLVVRAHSRKIFDKGSCPPPDKKEDQKKVEEMKTNVKTDQERPVGLHGDLEPREKESPGEMKIDTHADLEDAPKNETTIDLLDLPKETKVTFIDDFPNKASKDLEDREKVEEMKTNVKTDQERPVGLHSDLEPREKEPPGEMKIDNTHADLEDAPKNETTIDLLDLPKETKVTFIDDFPNKASKDLEDLTNLHTNAAERSPTNGEDDVVNIQNKDGDGSATSQNAKPNSHQSTCCVETSPTSTTSDEDTDPNGTAGKTSPTRKEGDAADAPDPQNAPIDISPLSPNEGAVEMSAPQETPALNGDALIMIAPPQDDMAGAVCMMPSLAQRERGNAKKESKLAKRSGYIIFTFLIFWIPLIAMVILNHFLYRNYNYTAEAFRQLEIFTVSLVCMTSFTNPIIYAAVNPQFRMEFYNLKTKWKAIFTSS